MNTYVVIFAIIGFAVVVTIVCLGITWVFLEAEDKRAQKGKSELKKLIEESNHANRNARS